MSYHQDWLMRQIEAISTMLAYLLSGKVPSHILITEQEATTGEENLLLLQLQALTHQNRVCEAENLLFEALEEPSRQVLDAANWFYSHLNGWTDQQLTQCDFSREEIMSGLQEVCKVFGIPI